jgi:hypothetical protein
MIRHLHDMASLASKVSRDSCFELKTRGCSRAIILCTRPGRRREKLYSDVFEQSVVAREPYFARRPSAKHMNKLVFFANNHRRAGSVLDPR